MWVKGGGVIRGEHSCQEIAIRRRNARALQYICISLVHTGERHYDSKLGKRKKAGMCLNGLRWREMKGACLAVEPEVAVKYRAWHSSEKLYE